MKSISKSAQNLTGQPMFSFLAKVKERERMGEKIIHFEIGDPNFDSPKEVVVAAKKSLDEGETHYTSSNGLFELREEITTYVQKNWGFQPTVEQTLVCPANAVIDHLLRVVANPGDEVIYPDPGFSTYGAVISYALMKGVPVPLREENDFRMSPLDIRSRVTSKTKLIIVNSPQNPTGSVMTEAEMREIYEIAKERNIYILTDEVYKMIFYEGKPFSPSVFDECGDTVILLFSFSKTFAMSGWRLGFAVGPKKIIDKMNLMFQTIYSCLPVFVQRGAVAALGISESFLKKRYEELKARRDVLVSGLNKLSGVSCVSPAGAFYAFPNIKGTGMTSREFMNKMLDEAKVSVLEGTAFGKEGEGYARLSYGSASVPEITVALSKMKKALET